MNIIKPMKTIASISTLCAVMAFSGIAVSASDTSTETPRHEHKKLAYSEKGGMKRMSRALSLSEEQQEQIKTIHKQAKEQQKALHDTMKKFKEAEKTLLQAESFDEQAFTALHEANQPTFTAMALIRAKKKHATFNILTAEQQEKWLKMTKKHKGKKGNRKSRAKTH